MTYSTVTLTGTYMLFDGVTPAVGTIEIIPSEARVLDEDGKVVLSGRVKVALDQYGSFSVALPATDDVRLNPSGFGYTVSAKLHHQHLAAVSFQLPAAVPTVDVAEVTTVDESTFTPGATYAPLATVTALDAEVDTLAVTVAGKVDAATLNEDVAGYVTTDGPTKTALKATYGPDAVAATNGKAKFAVSDSGLFVSKDASASDSNDGLSPGRAKATVAAAAAALPGGKGKVNVSGGTHSVTGLALTDGLVVEGPSHRSAILMSSGSVFTVASGQSIHDVQMRNVSIHAGTSAFAIAGSLSSSTFDDVSLYQTTGTAPVIDAAGMVECHWRIANMQCTAATMTLPLVRLVAAVNNVDAIAVNTFTGRATHSLSYVFHIEDATGGSYAENNRIRDFNFEIPNKGAVKILSGTGNILDNCLALDFSALIAVPLVKVGKSAASTKRSEGNRINWHRHGGTFGAGGYDVQLAARTDVRQTTLIDCWADTGGGFMADFANSDATVVNTDLAGASNAGWVQGTTNRGVKFIRDNKANWVGAATAGAGVALWDTISNKLLISDGTAWRDTMGTVVA